MIYKPFSRCSLGRKREGLYRQTLSLSKVSGDSVVGYPGANFGNLKSAIDMMGQVHKSGEYIDLWKVCFQAIIAVIYTNCLNLDV